jgi:hypothetical protein
LGRAIEIFLAMSISENYAVCFLKNDPQILSDHGCRMNYVFPIPPDELLRLFIRHFGFLFIQPFSGTLGAVDMRVR